MDGKLISHYRGHWNLFNEHFEKTVRGQDPEDIHQMRVDIKKLKALMVLVEFLSKGAFDRQQYSILFTNLFKKAGGVREAQLNLDLLAQYRLPKNFLAFQSLAKRRNRAMTSLLKEMHSFDFSGFVKIHKPVFRRMNKFQNERVLREAAVFVQNELRKVFKLKDLRGHQNLHKIRIRLKVATEVLLLINEIHEDQGLTEFREQIKILTDMIGEWHDKVVLHAYLKNLLRKNAQDPRLEKFVQRIGHQNQTAQQKIKKQLDKTIREKSFELFEPLS